MPSESTNLKNNLTANQQPTSHSEKTFRTAKRQSNLRANIFLLECAIVLLTYLGALYKHFEYSSQSYVLASFGIIYIVRLIIMSRWILKRELAIEEITFVIFVWIPSILASFVFLSKGVTHVQLVISSILYLFGSYINSWSEIERKIWKEDTRNKRRCYTQGLFSLSRNINYFGDTLLFAGWALATGNRWNAWVPITMGFLFYFYHIPDKENYLQTRYAEDWPSYKKKTPHSFVPYLC